MLLVWGSMKNYSKVTCIFPLSNKLVSKILSVLAGCEPEDKGHSKE